ncbi:MAG: hypothetical protein RSD49_01255 [Hafnia sp.]
MLENEFKDRKVVFSTEYKTTQILIVNTMHQCYGFDSVGFINDEGRLNGIFNEYGELFSRTINRYDAAGKFKEGSIRFVICTEAGEGIMSLSYEYATYSLMSAGKSPANSDGASLSQICSAALLAGAGNACFPVDITPAQHTDGAFDKHQPVMQVVFRQALQFALRRGQRFSPWAVRPAECVELLVAGFPPQFIEDGKAGGAWVEGKGADLLQRYPDCFLFAMRPVQPAPAFCRDRTCLTLLYPTQYFEDVLPGYVMDGEISEPRDNIIVKNSLHLSLRSLTPFPVLLGTYSVTSVPESLKPEMFPRREN